jgi:hypothetical protein
MNWRIKKMKTGRNQPCPCGSGKKFKKCCLNKAAPPSHELYYRRLSQAHDRLVDRLVSHAGRIFGRESIHVAMHDFLLWPEEDDEVTEESLDRAGPLFWPWYVFNWEYISFDGGPELPGPTGRTVAELYAEKQGGKLDSLEQRLIDGINRKPYSFLEVQSVDMGRGMTLTDILKGNRIEVQEHTGSQYVNPGDILFGRAVDVDGVGMLIGLSPTLIPPGRKAEVIQFRKQLRRGRSAVTDDILNSWHIETRELYFNIDRSLHVMPKLQNTDGDAMEFHRLVYEVSSTDAAFRKLCDLCLTMMPEELAADAEFEENSRMVRVEIPWDRLGHKKMSGMPNTVLGRILIDGTRLTAEVNSAQRAKALRREIDARLGEAGRFKVDEIQDFDAMMSRHTAGSAESIPSSEHEELMQHPEVQAQVAEMFSRHWQSWVDQEIPALGGKTPREAVKTTDGREAVEALLKDAERGRGQDSFTAEVNRKGAQQASVMLGLKDR